MLILSTFPPSAPLCLNYLQRRAHARGTNAKVQRHNSQLERANTHTLHQWTTLRTRHVTYLCNVGVASADDVAAHVNLPRRSSQTHAHLPKKAQP
jgi:hypothetical protein